MSFLEIDIVEDVVPLGKQLGVHPPQNVPEKLATPLFGEPELTALEAANYVGDQDIPTMNTYAILDAAKMPYLLTGILENSNLRFESLFQGQVQEDLQEQAPYLVQLSPSNDLTRYLLTNSEGINGLWERNLGIYIRSRASFKKVRRHFRKFIRIQDNNDKWYFFRFWESSYSFDYFPALGKSLEHVRRWFLIDGRWPVSLYIPCKEESSVVCVRPSESLPYSSSNMPIRYGLIEASSLSKTRLKNFSRVLDERLCDACHNFRNMPLHRREQIIITLTKQAKEYGIAVEQAVADYAMATILFKRSLASDPVMRKILSSDRHALDRAEALVSEVGTRRVKG